MINRNLARRACLWLLPFAALAFRQSLSGVAPSPALAPYPGAELVKPVPQDGANFVRAKQTQYRNVTYAIYVTPDPPVKVAGYYRDVLAKAGYPDVKSHEFSGNIQMAARGTGRRYAEVQAFGPDFPAKLVEPPSKQKGKTTVLVWTGTEK
jgi:hypothetical protein